MANANNDAIEKMRSAGLPVDQVPEEQRQVLNDLSPQEVETLVRIHDRARQAESDEVQGYLAGDKGGIIY